ncbi:MAG: hypothetical protein H0U87_02805 [Acidobacteria bacterium]|jgi:hypothetical protein|nr:hypothetical protein [Acidobacteriota bacterium]
MRFQIIFFAAIFTFAMIFSGCGASQAPTNSANANTSNKAANINVSGNSNNPLATTKAPEAATTNNAPTLAPVVQNFYAALQKKDEAGAKKFLSQAALAYWQTEMKSQEIPTLLAVLEDNESPVEEKREVRNEKIEGDAATAEMKGGSLGNWAKIKFLRENGEWKFASPKESLSLQDIERTDSNTAKK